MSYHGPIDGYHSQVYLILSDGTFKWASFKMLWDHDSDSFL